MTTGNISVIISPSAITFSLPTGGTRTVPSNFFNFKEVMTIAKSLLVALRNKIDEEILNLWMQLVKSSTLTEMVKKAVEETAKEKEAGNLQGIGEVTVKDGKIYYDGEVIHNAVVEKILWCIGEGIEASPYIKFLAKAMKNPLRSGIDGLWRFIDKTKIPITSEGNLLAYKVVRSSYMDVHSNTVNYSIGNLVEMDREKVNPDPAQTCSTGLHVCSFSYISQFEGNLVIMVEVDPVDVVAVPGDYGGSKMRVCRLKSVKLLGKRGEVEDVLSKVPVYDGKPLASFKAPESVQFAAEVEDKEKKKRKKIEKDISKGVIPDTLPKPVVKKRVIAEAPKKTTTPKVEVKEEPKKITRTKKKNLKIAYVKPAKPAKPTKVVAKTPVKTAKVAPAKVAPAKVAPVKVALAKVAPAKVAPAKVAPAKVAPAKVAPAKVAPAKVAPVKATPVKATPAKVAPVKTPAKTGKVSAKVAPVKATPAKVAPVKATPVKATPVKAAPAKAPAKTGKVSTKVAPAETTAPKKGRRRKD